MAHDKNGGHMPSILQWLVTNPYPCEEHCETVHLWEFTMEKCQDFEVKNKNKNKNKAKNN